MEISVSAPYNKQLEFINSIGEPDSGVSVSHFVGGRGSGKTHSGAYKLFISCLTYNNTLPHLWTFPTYRDCLDVGLRSWKEAIPQDLWNFRKSDMQIVLLPGTPKETFIDLRSRMIDSSGKQPFRGPTYCCALNDELAKDKTSEAWDSIRATLRHPRAKHKWCDSTSTPRMGWYYHLVTKGDCNLITYATSYDNPYVDKLWVKGLEASYSPDFAKQEISAQWVSQSGRIWNNCNLDEYWPVGNKHWASYDPSLPYELGCDLGVKSGWVIIQKHQPKDQYGNTVSNHPPINVIVGEYTPNDKGAQQVLSMIEQQFGYAQSVSIGGDYNTRAVTDSTVTPAIVLRSRGWNMDLLVPKSPYTSKELQYMVLSGLFHNAANQRRLCISDKLFQSDPDNKRGVKELIDLDTWPDKNVGSQYFNKDKGSGIGLEDIRDALLYWAVTKYPPTALKTIHSH